MRELGICIPGNIGDDCDEFLRLMMENGFTRTFVTENADTPWIAERVHRAGISFDTLHAPFGARTNYIWQDGEDGEASKRELIHCLDVCVQVGAPIAVVHLSSGIKPPPVTDIGRRRFTELVEHAEKVGVKIAFENQRILSNIAWAFEAFETETVGFCWDSGHEFCFTPGRQYMPLFGDRLICTHFHDNHCVYNDDAHLIPFEGSSDFERVARQLRESCFGGTLMLEIIKSRPAYIDTPIDEYLERAGRAARRLRDMIDG